MFRIFIFMVASLMVAYFMGVKALFILYGVCFAIALLLIVLTIIFTLIVGFIKYRKVK